MSQSPLNSLGTLILVMLFYSVSITLIAYALPDDMKQPIEIFQSNNMVVDMEETTGKLEEVVDRQLNVPLFDLGALAFYSGNLVVDLFLNFIFAIPQLAQIVLSVFFMFVQVDLQIQLILKMFVGGAIATIFVLMIINLILRVRSPGSVV
jgi:hypothetical protein